MDEAPAKDSQMVADLMLGKKIIEESAKLMLVLVFIIIFITHTLYRVVITHLPLPTTTLAQKDFNSFGINLAYSIPYHYFLYILLMSFLDFFFQKC